MMFNIKLTPVFLPLLFIFSFFSNVVIADDATTCQDAIEISTGTHTVDSLTGNGAIFGGASSAKWYYFIPTMDGVLKVNSCGGGVDTRLFILTGCTMSDAVIGSDDDCANGNGRNSASTIEIIVSKDIKYYVYWDNPWSSDGFDFTLALEPLPMVGITFKVNMEYANTSSEGMFLAQDDLSGDTTLTALMDDGNDTWSATLTALAGDTIIYKFLNGNSMAEAEQVPLTCGLADGEGGFMRRYIVPVTDSTVDPICFSKCAECPQMDCGDEAIEMCDDFETYAEGRITPYTGIWDTWSGIAGGNEDPIVSDDFAFSGDNSLKIEAGSNLETQNNILFKLGDKKSGQHELRWKMYIPFGKLAYYDLQKFQYEPGGPNDDGFAFQIQFNGDSTGTDESGIRGLYRIQLQK